MVVKDFQVIRDLKALLATMGPLAQKDPRDLRDHKGLVTSVGARRRQLRSSPRIFRGKKLPLVTVRRVTTEGWFFMASPRFCCDSHLDLNFRGLKKTSNE